ncbi:hypothetical protein FVEN_g6839 [Fusarium venenatum]|nr:hypothetical protein FVEN_g6839 [Fusarium venenatum]
MSDSEDHDHDFRGGDGQGGTYSALASTLRKNGHLVINGRPCKIVELSNDQEEVHFIGIDIFNGKKEYQFSYIDDDFLHLITADGGEKNDVPVPEGEIGDVIREYEDSGTDALITVISAMNEEVAISVKEAPRGS